MTADPSAFNATEYDPLVGMVRDATWSPVPMSEVAEELRGKAGRSYTFTYRGNGMWHAPEVGEVPAHEVVLRPTKHGTGPAFAALLAWITGRPVNPELPEVPDAPPPSRPGRPGVGRVPDHAADRPGHDLGAVAHQAAGVAGEATQGQPPRVDRRQGR